MKYIRIHKDVNLHPVKMRKENLVNVFYNLVEQYNTQDVYDDLIISKQELWELAGYKGEYKAEYIRDLISELTKSDTYRFSTKYSISGSMFITVDLGLYLRIYVPAPFREFLFFKKDIDLMKKTKKQNALTPMELDYWRRIGSKKSAFLVLLKKADILGINGKYNKRLYALLMQFKKSNFFISEWSIFRETLEIPMSYKACDIDKRILNKAKQELLKVNLKITKITKIKKGNLISQIKFNFKIIEELKEVEKIENPKPGKIIFSEKEYYNYADFLKKNNEKDTKFQREAFRLLEKFKV